MPATPSISSSFLAFFSGFGLSAYLPLATNAAFHDNRAFVGLVVGAFTLDGARSPSLLGG